MQPNKLSSIGQRLFRDIEFDNNENLQCEIRKHPFGLFLIYIIGIFITFVIFALSIGLAVALQQDSLQGIDTSAAVPYRGILLIGAIGLSLFVIGATFMEAYLYNSNVMLLTNEKIAQVLYKGIFNRKISQLSIGDVQDVTVVQNGIFAKFFNYGTLVIETAGEQQNYTFTFAADPYGCSKQIVGAHEENLKKYGN